MVERRTISETGAGEAERPPLTKKQFEATPEFRAFKKAIRKILKVSKTDLYERVKRAKETSPRAGNPNAPGRRKSGS